MKTANYFSLGGVAFSLFLAWLFVAFGIAARRFSTEAALFPMIVSFVGAMFGGINLIHSVAAHRAPQVELPDSEMPGAHEAAASPSPRALILALAGPLLYVIVLQLLGFWVASLLVLIGMPWLLNFGRRGLVLALAAVTVGSVYVIFVTVFAMHVPTGLAYDVFTAWLQTK
jgi:hypothetical protein